MEKRLVVNGPLKVLKTIMATQKHKHVKFDLEDIESGDPALVSDEEDLTPSPEVVELTNKLQEALNKIKSYEVREENIKSVFDENEVRYKKALQTIEHQEKQIAELEDAAKAKSESKDEDGTETTKSGKKNQKNNK